LNNKNDPNKKTTWGWKKGIGAVKSKLSVHPLPQKSSSYAEEYEFPNDVTDVSFDDLGKWLFRLAGWQGYVLRLLGVSEVEKSIMTDTFNMAVSKGINKKEKRVSKELAASEMMQENVQLRELKIALIEKDAEVLGLKRVADIYSFQYEAISREITRRAIEQKRTSHGLMPEGSEQ